MIEFDIDTARLALAAGTGKIVTKAGEPVEITCWDTGPEYEFYKLLGNIKSPLPMLERRGVGWSRDGKYLMNGDNSENDLVIKPTIT